MKSLREALMITTKKALGGVLITICNYDTYQNQKSYESTTGDTEDRTNGEPMENQPPPDNNKNNKNNKNNNKHTIEKDFDDAWKLYPSKTGSKQKAYESFIKWRKAEDTQSDILSGLNRYTAYVNQRRNSGFSELKWQNGS